MTDKNGNFTLLRKLVRAFGLSAEAVDDIVDRIMTFLSDQDSQPERGPEYPYHLRDDFLSAAETDFFRVLQQATEGWALICPKVALGDLFFAQAGDPRANRIFTNRIDRKHVDFILVDPHTVRPILGVELDDKSHQRPDRKKRDVLVNGVFAAAQLPLARVPVQRAYDIVTVREKLLAAAGRPVPVAVSAPAPVSNGPAAGEAGPACPKCGGAMVLRTPRAGGSPFWGCTSYPKCRGLWSAGAWGTERDRAWPRGLVDTNQSGQNRDEAGL